MTAWSKTVLAVILAATLGLHWALFQSVAWACMLVKYSATVPFKEALVLTFDGRHPCPLCKIVAAGKKAAQDQSNQNQKKEVKLDVFLKSLPAALFVPPLSPALYPPAARGVSWQEPPPIPPPRLA